MDLYYLNRPIASRKKARNKRKFSLMAEGGYRARLDAASALQALIVPTCIALTGLDTPQVALQLHISPEILLLIPTTFYDTSLSLIHKQEGRHS